MVEEYPRHCHVHRVVVRPGVHISTQPLETTTDWRRRYGFATLLSLYNKWMFSPQYYNFPYPLFVTTCHMIVQFFCAAMIRLFLAERFRPPERPTRQAYVWVYVTPQRGKELM